MNNTLVYNPRVCFIEGCCMSWLLLLYVLSTIAHAPSWSEQAMSSTSWIFNGIAGWNIHIQGIQGKNDILPWIHCCPLSVSTDLLSSPSSQVLFNNLHYLFTYINLVVLVVINRWFSLWCHENRSIYFLSFVVNKARLVIQCQILGNVVVVVKWHHNVSNPLFGVQLLSCSRFHLLSSLHW